MFEIEDPLNVDFVINTALLDYVPQNLFVGSNRSMIRNVLLYGVDFKSVFRGALLTPSSSYLIVRVKTKCIPCFSYTRINEYIRNPNKMREPIRYFCNAYIQTGRKELFGCPKIFESEIYNKSDWEWILSKFNVPPFQKEYRTYHNLPENIRIQLSTNFRKLVSEIYKQDTSDYGHRFLQYYYLVRLLKDLDSRPESKELEIGFGMCSIESKSGVNYFNCPIWSSKVKVVEALRNSRGTEIELLLKFSSLKYVLPTYWNKISDEHPPKAKTIDLEHVVNSWINGSSRDHIGIEFDLEKEAYQHKFENPDMGPQIIFKPISILYQQSPSFWLDVFLNNMETDDRNPYLKWAPNYEEYRRYAFNDRECEIKEKQRKREQSEMFDIFEAGSRLPGAGWTKQR